MPAVSPKRRTSTFRSLGDLFRSRLPEAGDSRAFTFVDKHGRALNQYSALELDLRARAVATLLREHGKAGDRVLIAASPGVRTTSALLGCFYAEMTAVPTFPPNSQGKAGQLRLEAICADAEASILIADTDQRDSLAAETERLRAVPWVTLESLEDEDALKLLAANDPPQNKSELPLLMYTSGSTGHPKGVMLTHEGVIASFTGHQALMPLLPDSVIFSCLPASHVAGLLSQQLLALATGHPYVEVSPQSFLERPQVWLEAVTKYRATDIAAPMFAFTNSTKAFSDAELENLDLSSIRHAICGGEEVRLQVLQSFVARFRSRGLNPDAIRPGYGMTENTTIFAVATGPLRTVSVDRAALESGKVVERPANDGSRLLVSPGAPYPGVNFTIVQPDTYDTLPEGVVGEIWIEGIQKAKGYWKRPEETEATFNGITRDARGPFIRSGDLGFRHQGELYISGRLKELIIIRGANHYLVDIQNTAEGSHPALRQRTCVAFPITHEDEEKLAVVVEVDSAEAPDFKPAQVVAALRRAISKTHGLQAYGVVLLRPNSVPRTPLGKLSRPLTKKGFLEGGLTALHSDLLNTSERSLPKVLTSGAPQNDDKDTVEQLLRETVEEGLAADPKPRVAGDVAEVEKALRQAIQNIGSPSAQLSADESLSMLGLDSVNVVRLSVEIEKLTGVAVTTGRLLDGPTLNELGAELMHNAGNSERSNKRSTVIAAAELEKKVSLDPALQFPGAISLQNVLLTGATGLLGAYILNQLLESTPATVHCLVRAESEAQGLARLQENLSGHMRWPEEQTHRIRVLLGDAEQPRLGLSGPLWTQLGHTVDTVIHSAAGVHFLKSYAGLEALNVNSTVEVLKLLSIGRSKRLHHVSTVSVLMSGGYPAGSEISEEAPLPAQGALPNGYAQTKWVADRLVSRARERGMAANIYRVGFLGGDIRSGRYPRLSDFFPRWIKGCIELGAAPSSSAATFLVPVDYAAKLLVNAALRPELQGKNFHVFHPRQASWDDLFETLRTMGYVLERVSFPEWRSRLQKRHAHNSGALFVFDELIAQFGESGTTTLPVGTQNALEAGRGLECPREVDLFQRYIENLVQDGFLPPP